MYAIRTVPRSAFVGHYIDYKNMHGMNNLKLPITLLIFLHNENPLIKLHCMLTNIRNVCYIVSHLQHTWYDAYDAMHRTSDDKPGCVQVMWLPCVHRQEL